MYTENFAKYTENIHTYVSLYIWKFKTSIQAIIGCFPTYLKITCAKFTVNFVYRLYTLCKSNFQFTSYANSQLSCLSGKYVRINRFQKPRKKWVTKFTVNFVPHFYKKNPQFFFINSPLLF